MEQIYKNIFQKLEKCQKKKKNIFEKMKRAANGARTRDPPDLPVGMLYQLSYCRLCLFVFAVFTKSKGIKYYFLSDKNINFV